MKVPWKSVRTADLRGRVLGIRCGLIYRRCHAFWSFEKFFKASSTHILITVRAKVLDLKNLLSSRFSSTKLCKPFDPVDYLESKEDCALYLHFCAEEDPGDGALRKAAALDIEKARGRKKANQKTYKEILKRDFGGSDEKS